MMTPVSDADPADPAELLGSGLWTRQGPATLVARETGWVVLVPGARSELVEAAWDLLGEAPTPEGFLDELVAAAGLAGADDLVAILFAIVDGTTAVLGVKGGTPLAVYTADGSQRIAGTEKGPVVMQSFQHVRRIAFGDLPPETSLGAPRVVAGVARVRGLVHAVVDPAVLDEEARTALAEQVEADGRSIEDPEEARRRAERPARTASPAHGEQPAAERTPAPALAEREQVSMRAAPERGSSSASSTAPTADPELPNVFDSLLADPSSRTAAPRREQPAPGALRSDPSQQQQQQQPSPQPLPPQLDQAPRRPLVSTSLFDRPRRTPDRPGRAADVENGREAAPSTSAALSSSEAPEEDNIHSADTLIAPIDEGERTQEIEDSAPRHRSRSRSGPRTRSDAPALGDPQAADPGRASAAIGAYDDLFGETLHRRIEDAAVRRSDAVSGTSAEAVSGPWPQGVGTESAPAAPAPAQPAPGRSTPGRPASERPVSEPAAPARTAPNPASATSTGPDASLAHGGQGSGPVAPGAAAHPEGDLIDWVPGVGRTAPEITQAAARRAAAPSRQESGGTRQPPPGHTLPQQPLPQQVQPQQPPRRLAPPQQPHPQQAPPVHPGPVQLGPVPPGSTPPRPVGRPGTTTPPTGSVPPPHGHRSTSSTSLTAVLLSGLVCPNGHANSPERTACGACGSVLTGTPRTVSRPPLGVIELSTGEQVVLDRSAILGRRPRASRVSARDVPQLITVPSPQQDISRSHLELRLEGWHVVAFDLGTTNGTTLYRANTEPVRLRSREGVMLRDGDTIDLGDGVLLRMRERM